MNAYYISDIILSSSKQKDKDYAFISLHTGRQINSILLDSNGCSVNIKQGDRGYLGEENCLK